MYVCMEDTLCTVCTHACMHACVHVCAYAYMSVFMNALNYFSGPAMLIPSMDLTRKLLFAMRLNHVGVRLGILNIIKVVVAYWKVKTPCHAHGECIN